MLLAGAGGCANRSLVKPHALQPPPMPLRELVRPVTLDGTERVLLEIRGLKLPLFLPDGWQASTNAGRLAVHFHTADWVAWGEHHRAGYRFPLLSVFLGSGSAAYRAPFVDPATLAEVLAAVAAELHRRNPRAVPINRLDVASFSAGYGAVRELVQQPEARKLIRRIVLSDSLYAGLTSGANGDGPRVVQTDQIQCWLPFARDAVAGRTTFVLTHSQIPTAAYASTAECAAALIHALELKAMPAPAGSPAAAGDWPLLARCDAGQFHVWSYGGTNASAHLVHPRNLAAVWRVLDAVGK